MTGVGTSALASTCSPPCRRLRGRSGAPRISSRCSSVPAATAGLPTAAGRRRHVLVRCSVRAATVVSCTTAVVVVEIGAREPCAAPGLASFGFLPLPFEIPRTQHVSSHAPDARETYTGSRTCLRISSTAETIPASSVDVMPPSCIQTNSSNSASMHRSQEVGVYYIYSCS